MPAWRFCHSGGRRARVCQAHVGIPPSCWNLHHGILPFVSNELCCAVVPLAGAEGACSLIMSIFSLSTGVRLQPCRVQLPFHARLSLSLASKCMPLSLGLRFNSVALRITRSWCRVATPAVASFCHPAFLLGGEVSSTVALRLDSMLCASWLATSISALPTSPRRGGYP